MNPVPTASTWWQLALILGIGTAAVVLAAALMGRLRPNARWERSVWVLGTLSLAALLVSPVFGWSQQDLLDLGYREKGSL